jgi:MFS family permease
MHPSAKSPPARPPSAYKWAVVAMLWLVCFFNYADRQSIFSVFKSLHDEFGFDKARQGLIASAFMWVYAFGAPFAGLLGDKLRRKDLILGGCLFWSLVTALTAWCGRLWQFVTVRALEGLGETFYFPASMSLISDYHGGRTRSRAMALHQSAVYAGTIGGGFLGGWFAEHYGWRTGFYFFGLAGLVLAVLLYSLLREPRRGQAEQTGGEGLMPLTVREVIPALAGAPAALALMAAFFGANAVAAVFLTWTPTFLAEKFHLGLAEAGLTGTLYIHLSSAATVVIGGVLADRLARRLRGGRALVQALGLLLGTAFVYLFATASDLDVLKVAMALFGACKGLYDANIFASLYDVMPPQARATAAGVMNTIGWGGGALGAMAVGWAATHGPYADEIDNISAAIAVGSWVYLGCGVLLLLTALLLSRQAAEVSQADCGPQPHEGGGS